ncbi:hypothetical protein NL529_34615, partial [Klebsiella pneumoniae]|nr:hypothetical protein [Klebsiella pneumoniae]
ASLKRRTLRAADQNIKGTLIAKKLKLTVSSMWPEVPCTCHRRAVILNYLVFIDEQMNRMMWR